MEKLENRKLMEIAIKSKEKAYTPYSNFKVGAAVLFEDGRISWGCNIENASYSPTICAERTAIFKGISEGYSKIRKIAIIGDAENTFPCGVCRQVIREFSTEKTEVIIGNSEEDFKVYNFQEILPYSFGPEDLGGKNV